HDLAALAPSAAGAFAQLGRDAHGHGIEVVPGGTQERDLALTFSPRHLLALRASSTTRHTVVVGHAGAVDVFDHGEPATGCERVGEAGRRGNRRETRPVSLENRERALFGLGASVPARPLVCTGDGALLLAPFDHDMNVPAHSLGRYSSSLLS